MPDLSNRHHRPVPLASGAALAWMLLASSGWAAPPDAGSDDARTMAPYKDWIETAHNPIGQLCCSIADGRPAEVREIVPGTLQVFYDRKHWPDGTDEWVDVPAGAILKQSSPLYEPIAWFYHGQLRCLALANGS